MSAGWISLHRQFYEHWLWKEKRIFSKAEAWLDILMAVNHSEQKVIIKNVVYVVKRGESIMSLDSWSKRWNWNKSKVRRFFAVLQGELMVVTKNETQTTRLTVCNYDSYQTIRNADETQMKRKRNASETQTTPNNNDNKENNINNVKEEFKNSLRPYLSIYDKLMLTEFYEYWTEHGVNDKKVRFEKEKSFSIERRLKTWKKRSKDFNKKEVRL